MRTLSDERGHWLVLYFYPKDDTPGCTTESCEFRDAYATYQATRRRDLGHQHPGQRQQGRLQGQVRAAVHAHRRRAARGRRALRRLGGEAELRQDLHGHRPRDVPHRPAGPHRARLGRRSSRTATRRRSWRPSTSSQRRMMAIARRPMRQAVRHRSWGETSDASARRYRCTPHRACSALMPPWTRPLMPSRPSSPPSTIERPERLMVIVAHPDDADFGPAATVAAWIRAGTRRAPRVLHQR